MSFAYAIVGVGRAPPSKNFTTPLLYKVNEISVQINMKGVNTPPG
jgi:hypothetical protein